MSPGFTGLQSTSWSVRSTISHVLETNLKSARSYLLSMDQNLTPAVMNVSHYVGNVQENCTFHPGIMMMER